MAFHSFTPQLWFSESHFTFSKTSDVINYTILRPLIQQLVGFLKYKILTDIITWNISNHKCAKLHSSGAAPTNKGGEIAVGLRAPRVRTLTKPDLHLYVLLLGPNLVLRVDHSCTCDDAYRALLAKARILL